MHFATVQKVHIVNASVCLEVDCLLVRHYVIQDTSLPYTIHYSMEPPLFKLLTMVLILVFTLGTILRRETCWSE
jgi:hypothetical protein